MKWVWFISWCFKPSEFELYELHTAQWKWAKQIGKKTKKHNACDVQSLLSDNKINSFILNNQIAGNLKKKKEVSIAWNWR